MCVCVCVCVLCVTRTHTRARTCTHTLPTLSLLKWPVARLIIIHCMCMILWCGLMLLCSGFAARDACKEHGMCTTNIINIYTIYYIYTNKYIYFRLALIPLCIYDTRKCYILRRCDDAESYGRSLVRYQRDISESERPVNICEHDFSGHHIVGNTTFSCTKYCRAHTSTCC